MTNMYTLMVMTAKGKRKVRAYGTSHAAWMGYNAYRKQYPDRECFVVDCAGDISII